jgi:hypothetical protein
MLGKTRLFQFGLMVMALLMLAASPSSSVNPPPEPFGKYLVYSAAGVYDPSIPPAEGDLAEWFHKEIMGRDDAAIAAERARADAYFQQTFGAFYTPGSLEAFGVDPRLEYRAYFISGMRVPPEGFVVRDGGFRADLSNGGFVVFGEYNIKVTNPGGGRDPEPIIIHYESEHPIFETPTGLFFLCRLSSEDFEDFGGGLAQGISSPKTLPDGRTVANIRNILTFPGLGFAAQP